jgi:hypothetical protein
MVIRFISCKDITVANVTMVDAPMWMQQYVACENLIIQDITVRTFVNRNNDGLDLVGCRNVVVKDCKIDSDDDAICLKTLSTALMENITIKNCVVSSNCNGIKIGTETRAPIRNITIRDCGIHPTGIISPAYHRDIGLTGIAIESVDGAIVEDVDVSNVTISGVNSPLFIRLGNRGRKYSHACPDPPVGIIRNIRIRDVKGTGEDPWDMAFSGIRGYPIENLHLSDVEIQMPGGMQVSGEQIEVPEDEVGYPRPQMFGKHLPGWGMYFRHVRGLELQAVTLNYVAQDLRPAIVLDDVFNVEMEGVDLDCNANSLAVIRMENSGDVALSQVSLRDSVQSFLLVEGAETGHIVIEDCDLSLAEKMYELKDGAMNLPVIKTADD